MELPESYVGHKITRMAQILEPEGQLFADLIDYRNTVIFTI